MNKRLLVSFFGFMLFMSCLLIIPMAGANPSMGWLTPVSAVDYCGSGTSGTSPGHWCFMGKPLNGILTDASPLGCGDHVITHWIAYDLGCSREVTKFRWYVSNNLAAGSDKIDSCNIYVSDSLSNWGVAVATGVSFNIANQWNEQTVTTKTGRFINVTDINTAATGDALNQLNCYEIQVYCELVRSPPSLHWHTPTAIINKCGETDEYVATNLIDSSLSTYWIHDSGAPHWIVMDLGDTYYIYSFAAYLSIGEQDRLNIYVSNEPAPANWGSAVNYKPDMLMFWGGFSPNATLNIGTLGRYVKFTINDAEAREVDVAFLVSEAPSILASITLNSPANVSTIYAKTVSFNFTPVWTYSNDSIVSADLYVNGLLENSTFYPSLLNSTPNIIAFTFSVHGSYVWYIRLYNSTDYIQSTTRMLTIELGYYLTVGYSPLGTTNPVNGTYAYSLGDTQIITATPINSSWRWSYWQIGLKKNVYNPITAVMDKNYTYAPVFASTATSNVTESMMSYLPYLLFIAGAGIAVVLIRGRRNG